MFNVYIWKVLEWTSSQKGIPEALVRSVMSLHEGARTRFILDSEFTEELEV